MKLPEDFDNRAFTIFTAEEMSEPLIMVYRHLNLAVITECDKLILTPNNLRFLANNRELLRFPINIELLLVHGFYKECFLRVFERDPLVQQLFRQDFSDEGELIIRVSEQTGKYT